MNSKNLKLFATLSFIAAGISFLIGTIMLFPSGGYYQTENDFIEAIPFWILSMGCMVSGIGWLILKEIKK